MTESEHHRGCIEWIELSFVERQWTPEWASGIILQVCYYGMPVSFPMSGSQLQSRRHSQLGA
jgi:hypothetical protein